METSNEPLKLTVGKRGLPISSSLCSSRQLSGGVEAVE